MANMAEMTGTDVFAPRRETRLVSGQKVSFYFSGAERRWNAVAEIGRCYWHFWGGPDLERLAGALRSQIARMSLWES